MVGYIHNIPGAKICDIGSGKGFLVRRLVKAGAKSVMAVDITTEYFNTFIDDERVTPIIANAENLPFKEEFDVITSTDVLEHVLNAGSFLISVYEALKPNGMAYIRVPYKEDLLNYAPQRGCKYKFVHLRSFNKDLLRGLVTSAGFEVQKFHLDGFSIQTPQNYIRMDRAVSSWLYGKWQARQLKKLKHASDVTLYNSFLAKIMMRPQEVVVVLRKNR
jgi:cyclopropane fatty-acyl-phospholipid synthase-like methyltransferase